MKPETAKFLRSRFREYYLEESLEPPPNLERREWGFILFDDMPKFVMRRHKSFLTRSELVDYIRTQVPAHAYHSAALYERPGAPTMREKALKGVKPFSLSHKYLFSFISTNFLHASTHNSIKFVS